MAEERGRRIQRILDAAAEKGPDQRAELLEELGASDPDLREAVASLLAGKDDSFLDKTPPVTDGIVERATANATPIHSTADTEVPDRVGPYRILREIGEGGMGIVYEAEQKKPVRRKVALKLIKWGMDTKAVIARFDSERQALALMNHANIASVFDAGATEEGRPYFAMEHVQGIPITEYCDRYRLTIAERLKLFIQVCDGVQHAHQKGIIHRDIKPSNVLVAVYDDKAVPKIIDFGVAKATSQRLTEHTVATELGQLVGTPEYMSPEQAEMTNLDIDTRADVYSLGVLLYELLVGAHPFDPKELRRAGLPEIQRRLREEEPSKPSTRVSSLGKVSSVSASNRRIELKALVRQLEGDLDWITMKALEKDRTRRYETANALALDVGRFLNSEPVRARPPSPLYRARKFVRRHRVGVSALSFTFVSLLVAIILTGSSLVRARRAEQQARDEARRATAVTAFLEDMLSSADPAQDGRNVRVVEVLERASNETKAHFADQPDTEASVRQTLATTLIALGQYQDAVHELERAHRIRRTELGEDDATTLKTKNDLVAAYFYVGNLERAEELGREGVRLATDAFGPAHDLTIEMSTNLSVVLSDQGKLADAVTLNRTILEAARARYGNDHETTLVIANNLAINLKKQGEPEQAESLYREVLEARTRRFGEEHPETLNVKHNLGILLNELGESSEAESIHREVLEVKLRILGPEHPKTVASMNGLALALLDLERYEEAASMFERLVELAPRVHTSSSSIPFIYVQHYGMCLKRMGRFSEAEALLLRAHRGLESSLGAGHNETMDTVVELVELYEAWDQPEKAAEYRALLEDNPP